MRQQIRFCRTGDGVTLAYARTGAGPPLVKTANWMSHLEHDWRTPLWKPFLARLSEGRTLVRYDQRGAGLSDWTVSDFSFDAGLRDLEAVVDACGLRRFPLLGISQGGAVALAYAAKHPDRVSRLVLYGAYARGQIHREPADLQREEVETMMRLIRLGWGGRNAAYGQVFASMFLPGASPDHLRAFNDLQRLSTSAENAVRIASTFTSLDVRPLAPRVEAPALVLHVRGDARVPFEEGRLLASLLPDAQFVPLEGRNHVLLPEDRAFDQVTAEIDRFLSAEAPWEPAIAASLTRQERAVLELVAQGLGNREIARRLAVSDKTVRNHVSSIFSKLGVEHRPQAIVLAREAGFGRAAPRAGR